VLDTVLMRLARFRERSAEIRSKVVGATIYPSIVLFVAFVVISVMIVYVIPKFSSVFNSFGIELPGLTQTLLNVSDFAVTYWYIVIGLPALGLVAHVVFFARSTPYRHLVHKLMLKVPYLGAVLQRSITSTFARTFGTLVQAGVPHLDALRITRETTSNEVLGRAVEMVHDAVREGESIARPMQNSGVFDDMTTNMVEVGEQTGELDRMLLRVADAYEVQVERRIDALFKVLEPLLLVVLAAFVGVIVVALFLPMLSLMSGVGGVG
jgi:type IV pilus assembly protein PilC